MHSGHHIGRAARSPRALALLALAAASVAAPRVASAQVDPFVLYYNGNNVAITNPPGGNGHPSMGGFDYDATNDAFWDATFGGAGQGIYKVTPTNATPAELHVGTTDWVQKFLSSSDVTTGTIASGASAISTVGDILLNPASLTIGPAGNQITYAPGTLAIAIEGGKTRVSNTVQPTLSKLVYAYDLRKIGGTAAGGRDWNANGTADWNDVFWPIASFADQRAAAGSTSVSNSVNRRPAFSSDGQSLYYLDSSSAYGGLYKTSLTTGATSRLATFADPNTEPAVVSSSVRSFGVGAGDQIVVQGAADIGNAGGLSYYLDNGTTVAGPRTLISGKQMGAFLDGGAVADVRSVTADADGNLYFASVDSGAGYYRYDTQGRLVKLASAAEHRALAASQGINYNQNSFDLKVRTSASNPALTELLFNEFNLRAPVGITAYAVGDFDRDNVVDADDVSAFKSKLALRGVAVATQATNTADLKYDLNGSFSTSSGSSGVASVAIDWKDVKIFQQFTGMSAGDVDMDFDVDADDLGALGANYGGTGKLFTDGNLTSVRIASADRDDVNFADLVTLAASWTAAKPGTAAPVGAIPAADMDRAFAIAAGGTISEFAGASGAWGAAAQWGNGVVPNAPGAVASLLTKPGDDVTLELAAVTTLGQLNFDHYFDYTINAAGGGALAFDNGGGGRHAEINAFAASPTINAPVALAAPTDVTVTYAADTLAITGGVQGAGDLHKKGAGTLRLTGALAYTGATHVAAGTLQLQTNLTTSPLVSVTGGTLELASGGGSNRVIVTDAVSVAAGGKLDLKDNKLIVRGGDLGASDGTTYTGLTRLIQTAYQESTWSGDGLTTSMPDATTGLTTLAIATAAQVERTTFGGVSVDGDDVLVMYTYGGDTNFDGKLDADDYGTIDFNVLVAGAEGYYNGDFNYDGVINADDYGVIDFNILAQTTPFPTGASGEGAAVSGVVAVPEPASLMLSVASLALLARRRRRAT